MKQHESIQCEENKLPLHMPIFDANLDLVSKVPFDLDRTVGQTRSSNPRIVAGIHGKGISKNYKEMREENQAIKDYEQMLCQIKVEVGSKIQEEMISESKEHVDAAVNLKRYLSMHGQTDIDFAFEKELKNKLATEIYHADVQLVGESTLSECVTKVSSLEEQILADSMKSPIYDFSLPAKDSNKQK
ncbi:hypothetical protein PsorP6_010584 [Peronosclerospora sorghi]|uniref:Uncharacterized protein n=1 Tax=Peronosclerospora sorghi TaxID=230839 RepID=A0ACC0VVL2_9STRA|nr:hypothetical protein PsorP6_010584 [Peronosclerospora sorghi]